MEQSEAQQKFFKMPEMVAKLISFLPPQSALHLAQSHVVDKGILQKSLGSEAWGELIKQGSHGENGELNEEDVNCFVKILKLVELNESSKLILPLLDHICKLSGLNTLSWVMMICPCNKEPHVISPDAFLLLEQVEGAFGTTLQSIQSVRHFSLREPFFSAIISRMSRMNKAVASINVQEIVIDSKNSAQALTTLVQAQSLDVRVLDAREAIGEEVWQVLAKALRNKPGVLKLDEIEVLRQGLAEAKMEDIKDIWDATDRCFIVYSLEMGRWAIGQLRLGKDEFDRESVWTRLNQILAYTEDEFEFETGYEEEYGDSESGEEEEEHDSGEDVSDDEDLEEEGGQGGD